MAGKRSPLHAIHEKNNAKFVDQSGWEVPGAYTSPESEYSALRNQCGLIDLCHLSRYRINGAHRIEFLDSLVTTDLEKMPVRTCGFTFMCNEKGGIIDGLLVYKEEQYLLFNGHGANRQRVLDWLRAQAEEHPEWEVEIVDVGAAQGQIELRGPTAQAVLEAAALVPVAIQPNESTMLSIGQARCLVNRRTFAGTNGYMLVAGAVYLQAIWEQLVAAGRAVGLRPVGEKALEMLRVEAAHPGVGSEIDADTTPLDAGMGHLVDFSKEQFIGRHALIHQTIAEFRRRLVLLRNFTKALPPDRADVFFETVPVGTVSSVSISPQMGCGVALAYVDAIKAAAGTRLKLRTDRDVMDVEVVVPANPTRI